MSIPCDLLKGESGVSVPCDLLKGESGVSVPCDLLKGESGVSVPCELILGVCGKGSSIPHVPHRTSGAGVGDIYRQAGGMEKVAPNSQVRVQLTYVGTAHDLASFLRHWS